jgi:hypothetical protein
MATIVTRAGKGSTLTHAEMDANFNNLNNEVVTKATTSSLGDSAYDDVQTNAYDTTSGRTPRLGYFGLGSSSYSRTRPTDLNNFHTASQFNVVASSTPNAPTTNAGWVRLYDWDSNNGVWLQEFIDLIDGSKWQRVMRSVWSEWECVSATGSGNQYWQTVTRVQNTAYTNTTNRPIMVAIVIGAVSIDYNAIQVKRPGGGWVSIGAESGAALQQFQFIVPHGHSYIANNVPITVWKELR